MTHVPNLIALTSEVSTNEVSPSELTQVAGALQRQANEELRRAWTHINCTVVAVPDPTKVPHGYAPITVKDDIGAPGAAGYHTDDNGQPYSLVQYDSEWSLTASHEFVEMALDPLGSSLYRAPSPDPAAPKRHVVRVLLELGDPVEASRYSYVIDGVQVSDFILHQFGNGRHGPYDHMGHLKRPRSILPGGYLSWMEPDGEWRQLTWFDSSGPTVNVLGRRDASHRDTTLREWIDRQTQPSTPEVDQ